jgi:hypothetical protein
MIWKMICGWHELSATFIPRTARVGCTHHESSAKPSHTRYVQDHYGSTGQIVPVSSALGMEGSHGNHGQHHPVMCWLLIMLPCAVEALASM